MMISRNPFRIRVAEKTSEEFLSLFSLKVLDIFDVSSMWEKIQILQSARGGGKTSILKMFMPKLLKIIYDRRRYSQFTPFYNRLKELDVYDETGVKVLGIYLTLDLNYAILNQLEFINQKNTKYFFALLSIRIILAAIRSILESKGLEFKDENLNKIYFKKPTSMGISSSIPVPCDAKKLNDWAADIESIISNIIDGDLAKDIEYNSFKDLSILNILMSGNVYFDDSPICKQTLLMLDDVHTLSSTQRKNLTDVISNTRFPITIWLAERLEALSHKDIISTDATSSREYDSPIILERYWSENSEKFHRLMVDIANKRAHLNKSYNINSFETSLLQYIDDNKYNDVLNLAKNTELEKVKKYEEYTQYRYWFDECDNSTLPPIEQVAQWRQLEIAIERDLHKQQQRLNVHETRTSNEFKLTSKEIDVSVLYVCTKYGVPYYYGSDKLVKLASSNIQQFLYLASDCFDEMINQSYSKQDVEISADKQEKILTKAAKKYYDVMMSEIPQQSSIETFLNSIGKFCYEETNTTKTSYGPVTGIGIKNNVVQRLRDDNGKNSRYKKLSDVISICIMHNFLEPRVDLKQGKKGTKHLILYLNRVLCLQYRLPLIYGGWRHHDLNTLCSYYEGSNKRRDISVLSSQTILEDP